MVLPIVLVMVELPDVMTETMAEVVIAEELEPEPDPDAEF